MAFNHFSLSILFIAFKKPQKLHPHPGKVPLMTITLPLCYTKITVPFCKPCSYRSSFLAAGSTSQLISPIYSQQDHLTLHWFYSFKVKISDVILTHPVVLSFMLIFMEWKNLLFWKCVRICFHQSQSGASSVKQRPVRHHHHHHHAPPPAPTREKNTILFKWRPRMYCLSVLYLKKYGHLPSKESPHIRRQFRELFPVAHDLTWTSMLTDFWHLQANVDMFLLYHFCLFMKFVYIIIICSEWSEL